MATRFKSVLALLAFLMVVATAACTGEPLAPTPNIDATVEAKVGAALTKITTVTPIPTPTPVPTLPLPYQQPSRCLNPLPCQ